ncbi:MAG: restriction endonuclease subunit S [Chloroflexota bacterium]|nr:restriction endonuclease subunit S [Chloroflexota bacterium]
MRNKWVKTSVEDFCKFSYGKGLPKRDRNRSGSIPVFGSNGRIDYHDEPYVKGPGIIIGRKGSIGNVHYSPGPFWPIDTTFFVTENNKRNLRFTYFLLKSLQLDKMNSDSAVPGLNRDAAHMLEILIPQLPTQERIADILGTLDDKIELNRQMNHTLEAMARAIFKSWFVDFDPVYAKMEGCEYPLPAEVMDLFPDELVESEMGLIPEGWEIREVSDFGKVITGKTPTTKNPDFYSSEDVPFLKIPDMHNQFFIAGTSNFLSRSGADSQINKYIPPKSICVSCIATPGLVVMSTQQIQTNQQINSLVPKSEMFSNFLLLALKRKGDEIRLRGSGGSVLRNLNKTDFLHIQLLIPNDVLIKYFDSLISPIFDKIVNNKQQNQILSKIRESLLTVLISGVLEVK